MAKFNTELLVVLANQITVYSSLRALKEKHYLNFYNVLTPGMISSIDSEVNANPFILSEAITLLESAAHIGHFYESDKEVDFISTLKKTASNMRLMWENSNSVYNPSESLHSELMEEYFVTTEDDFISFLENNPAYLGIYLYIFVTTTAMA